MSTSLGDVILRGLFAALPAASIPGRLYFANDTGQTFRDNGTTWDNVTGAAGSGTYAVDSGTANTYAASGTPALATGLTVELKVAHSNTGASTFNWNGGGAVAIKKTDGATALTGGEMVAGQISILVYDGTVWQLIGGGGGGGGSAPSGAANLVYATPNGSSGSATLRALVSGDLPKATSTTIGAMKPDGTTVNVDSSGILSAIPGTVSGTLISGSGTPTGAKFVQGLTGAGASLAFPTNVTSGNLLIVAFSTEGSIASITISDTQGTSYSVAASQTGVNNLKVFYGVASSSGANTVTIGSAPGSFDRIGVAEYSGVTGVVDATATTYSNTTSTSIPITSTVASDLLFLAGRGFHNANVWSVAGGFAIDSQSNGSDANFIAHALVGGAATYTAVVSMVAGAGDNQAFVLVAFKTTTGGSTPGIDGDFYIDLSSKGLWGPRSGGGYNLIGTLN